MAAPINECLRKNLEASFIALGRLLLTEQIDLEKILLLQNGVTWQLTFNDMY